MSPDNASHATAERARTHAAVERAQRIHTMRTRHQDPTVRAEAHSALTALNPSPASAAKLSEVLANDVQIRDNPDAARTIRASAAALTIPRGWSRLRDAAINEAHNTATRRQAQEAVHGPPAGRTEPRTAHTQRQGKERERS